MNSYRLIWMHITFDMINYLTFYMDKTKMCLIRLLKQTFTMQVRHAH